MHETKETVQLARLDWLDNVYLANSESPHPMKLVSAVGARLPAHATGIGKALLAGLDDHELEQRLSGYEFQKFTEHTLSDCESLITEIQEVRRRGFAEDKEEYVIGCRCIGMPVRDREDRVVVAMSVTVPTPRFNSEVRQNICTRLRAAVSELQQALSGKPRVAGLFD